MIHIAAAALAARPPYAERRPTIVVVCGCFFFSCARSRHTYCNTHILPEWHNLAAAFATRPEAAPDEHASVRNQYKSRRVSSFGPCVINVICGQIANVQTNISVITLGKSECE